jgi:hypothetical protein
VSNARHVRKLSRLFAPEAHLKTNNKKGERE